MCGLVGVVLSIVWAVPASAQVMYKCTSSNGWLSYSFQARNSARESCSAITMSDAYRDGVVLKQLSLVCTGLTEYNYSITIPAVRGTETFHLVNGRWNDLSCLWTTKHIFCSDRDDDIQMGDHTLSINRYSGSIKNKDRFFSKGKLDLLTEFDGTCEVKANAKF